MRACGSPYRCGVTLPESSGGGLLPVRAGNEERWAVVRRLEDARSEGRISPVELLERSDLAWRARTVAELDALVDDLPRPGVALPASSGVGERHAVAVLGSSHRHGRWRLDPELTAVAVVGSCDLDLRNAELAGGAVTITAVAVLGAISLVVPPGTEVTVSGLSVLGARSTEVRPATGEPTMRVRVRGFALLGGVHVHERAVGDGPAYGR